MSKMKKCAINAVLSLLLVLVSTPLLALDATIINQAIRDKGANWVAGETSVSNLTPEELRRLLPKKLGRKPGQRATSQSYAAKSLSTLPAKFDWRNVDGHSYVTGVKNQVLEKCGACWAFTATAALESRILITSHTPDMDLDLSEQAFLACDANEMGCGGGFMDTTMAYLAETGIPLEADAPYTAGITGTAGACTAPMQQNTYRVVGFENVDTSVESMKSALVQYGPLVAGFVIYTDFLSYKSGVYSQVTGVAEGGHMVTIIGYDEEDQSWVVKNSFGPDWGEEGYFRIRAGTNECRIEDEVYAIHFAVVPGASFVLNPPNADFGTLMLPNQTSRTIPFTITNNGSLPLPNTFFTVTNQNYSVYPLSVPLLESAASADFQVTYTGRAGKTPDSGELQVLSAGVARNMPLSAQANSRPAQPLNLSPADGSYTYLPVTLFASEFVDDDGDTHEASRWIINNAAGDSVYAGPFDAASKTSFTVPSGILQADTQYFWQVIYRDDRGVESFASAPTSFTTRNYEKGGCFIATMAFGSPMAGQVEILRQFRDRYLLTNSPGEKFVAWYYRTGPAVADYIKDMPLAKAAIRVALYPLIGFSWLLISGYLPVAAGVLFLTVFLFFRYIQYKGAAGADNYELKRRSLV